jgi:hypothetical protein
MDSTKYIGLDVHQATISVAVRDSAGKLVMESILETKASTILDSSGGWAETYGSPSRKGPALPGCMTYSNRTSRI